MEYRLTLTNVAIGFDLSECQKNGNNVQMKVLNDTTKII
jgi:hypothetical protein